MEDNFFILLELPYDPPVSDPARIKTALHKKKQEWTRWQDNPKTRPAALKYLDMAPEIERTMLDPARREEQAAQAAALCRDALRRMEAELRVLEDKGWLQPREVASLAVRYKPYGADRDKVKGLARVPVTDSPPGAEAEEEPGELMDEITARSVERGLAVVGKPDLYAFLGEAPYASLKKLTAAAEQKQREARQSGGKSAALTATQELSGICLRLFQSFDDKQKYDRYLRVNKYPELSRMIAGEQARSGYISPSVMVRLVNFGVESCGVGVLEAEEYIRAHCAAYGVPVDVQGGFVDCPCCGERNRREAAACGSCAAPLRGECPGCGAEFSGGAAACTACGFNLSGMGKALRYLDDAQNAIIENNWSTAQRNVQYLKKYWPGHPQIQALEKRARNLEDRYAQYMEQIGDCVRHNQYYAAQELIDEARARRFQLPAGTVTHVGEVIAEVEAELAALMEQHSEPPIEKILALAGLVGDSIELSRLMKRQPPQPPPSLSASLRGGQVRLNWEVSPSPGRMEYVLVRKKGGLSLTAFDGDILYEGPAAHFEDNFAGALREYYYSVFSKRSGAYSAQGASTGPVLIIPELQNLRIAPVDQGARLSWDYSPDIREVIIWRKLGGERPTAQGDGIRLENTRVDGFNDSRIKNDVEYWYYLVAVYLVDGKKVYSPGVCDRVVPHKFMAPIENLVAVHSEGEDQYVVSWEGGAETDAILLASSKLPDIQKGAILPVQELYSRFRRVDMEIRGERSAAFTMPLNGGVYLLAASVFGTFASVGQHFYLTNVKNIQQPTWDRIGNDLFLNMKWPQGLSEVVLSYRYDHFPEAPVEPGTTVITTTREQYDFDAAIIIREPERVVYYAKLFSVFTTPDGERVFSDGVEMEIDITSRQEISYSFKYQRKLFQKTGNVSVTLSSPQPLTMPKAVLVGKVGRLPLNKTDGMPLFEVEKETRVNGELTYQYQIEALPPGLHVRLFLQEDEGYRRFRLLPAHSAKIT